MHTIELFLMLPRSSNFFIINQEKMSKISISLNASKVQKIKKIAQEQSVDITSLDPRWIIRDES